MPLKSILRNSSTRSLDIGTSSDEAARNAQTTRRAAMKRSVSFSGGCRWQERSSNKEVLAPTTTMCRKGGPRMPLRRACDDEPSKNEKGLRMPVRSESSDCKNGATTPPPPADSKCPLLLAGKSQKQALRMPIRKTFSFKKSSHGDHKKSPVPKSRSFQGTSGATKATVETHHVQRVQLMRNNMAMALSA
ncbi:expressed unknown protein [Seminavis robusta]|uniref:Uncharacterized protein n=1 Tax=Seminavis robusta TaxID=568900 RepID=A0A9N8HFI1_9STRA|nr:expressed unknown protein [Seminavis robusta]|eukprot:Sro572_g168840.1 n/a (190) ;mRNA; r:42200-42769